MLSDKIFTEEEEYRLRYSENPDFLRLKTWGTEPIQILVLSTLHLVTASLVLGHVNRFGKYRLDSNRRPPALEFNVPIV